MKMTPIGRERDYNITRAIRLPCYLCLDVHLFFILLSLSNSTYSLCCRVESSDVHRSSARPTDRALLCFALLVMRNAAAAALSLTLYNARTRPFLALFLLSSRLSSKVVKA